MIEVVIENPMGKPNYKVRGEDETQVTEAASEFQKALAHLDHFQFDWENASDQAGLRKKEIEYKYQIEIVK